MMSSPFPQNYQEWHHCITVECNIALTADFIAERLAVWRNEKSEETKRFRRLHGDGYLRDVIGWFERAEREIGTTSGD